MPDIGAIPTTVLRGHHLVCLHFYDGTGYSPAYIKHLANTLKTAEQGSITICAGADCICIECPYLNNRNCAYYENAEADIRLMDCKALELLGLNPDEQILWKEVRERVEKIFHIWHGFYCKECAWKSACEKNAHFRSLVKSSNQKEK